MKNQYKKLLLIYGFCVLFLFTSIGFARWASKIVSEIIKTEKNTTDTIGSITVDTIEEKYAVSDKLPKNRFHIFSKVRDLAIGDEAWISSITVDTSGNVFIDPSTICKHQKDDYYSIKILHGHKGYIINLTESKDTSWTAWKRIPTDRYYKAQKVIWNL